MKVKCGQLYVTRAGYIALLIVENDRKKQTIQAMLVHEEGCTVEMLRADFKLCVKEKLYKLV
jgi:hypothetical protein